MTTEERINHVASMLAAAYWRGRLEQAGLREPAPIFEAMLKAAAETDKTHWIAAAKIAVSGAKFDTDAKTGG